MGEEYVSSLSKECWHLQGPLVKLESVIKYTVPAANHLFMLAIFPGDEGLFLQNNATYITCR